MVYLRVLGMRDGATSRGEVLERTCAERVCGSAL